MSKNTIVTESAGFAPGFFLQNPLFTLGDQPHRGWLYIKYWSDGINGRDNTIWLLTNGPKSPLRWISEDGCRHCVVKSEAFNRIDIIYMDPKRYIYPHLSGMRTAIEPVFEEELRRAMEAKPDSSAPQKVLKSTRKGLKRIPMDLLQSFVKIRATCLPKPLGYVIDAPALPSLGATPEIKPSLIPSLAGPEVEITQVRGTTRYVRYKSGPNRPTALSPEFEDAQVSRSAEHTGDSYSLSWTKPFDLFWPTGGGADILYHQKFMIDVLRHTRDPRPNSWATRLKESVGNFTKRVDAPYGDSQIFPELRSSISEDRKEFILGEIMDKTGTEANTEEELLSLPMVQKELARPVPVKRVYGFIGLLLVDLERLFRNKEVAQCKDEDCGNIIWNPGRKQQYCKNPECARRRSKKRTRKYRDTNG